MKKILAFLLALFFSFCLMACGDDGGKRKGEEDIGIQMKITINKIDFMATLYDNDTAKALTGILPMTINMNAMAHEKYYYLPNSLPVSAQCPKAINEGDIMLYGSNCLVLFYESFSTSYSYTKIGKINDVNGLAAAVGLGNIEVTFSISNNDNLTESPNNENGLSNEGGGDEGGNYEINENGGGEQNENGQAENLPNEDDKDEDSKEETEVLEMKITINGKTFTAVLYDNPATKALIAMLPMTINMSAMAHEKYYYLPSGLPTAASNPVTIQEGDIMLWGSSCLVLFYESFSTSYSYTKIGKIQNTAGLAAAAGSGSVDASLYLK